jgi:hypothetical protein
MIGVMPTNQKMEKPGQKKIYIQLNGTENEKKMTGTP